MKTVKWCAAALVLLVCLLSGRLAFSQTCMVSGHVRTAAITPAVNVVLGGFPGSPVMTDTNGFYSAAVTCGWSGTVTPSHPFYSFSPPSMTYTNLAADLGDQDYTAVFSGPVHIGGSVRTATGNPIPGVAMNGLPGPPVTDSMGQYWATVTNPWSGTVTPTLAGYTFAPASTSYVDIRTSQTEQNYTGTLGSAITISGYARTSGGTPIPGVTIEGLPGPPVTDAVGFYSVTVAPPWSGMVWAQAPGYIFTPMFVTYSNLIADATQDYLGTGTGMLTISGYVKTAADVPVPGVQIGGLPGPPITDPTGFYRADVTSGWSGTVTPTLFGYTFTPPSSAYANLIESASQGYVGGSVCETELAAAREEIASLTAQLADANAAITSLRARVANLESDVTQVSGGLEALESDFRVVFRQPLFTIPGGTTSARFQSVVNALLGLTKGEKNPIYRGLFSGR